MKKNEPKVVSAPSFLSTLNLDRINDLYKRNKELNKESQESHDTKKKISSSTISITSIQQIKEEYDPARPNDYE
jgi:hypothetical protein